MNKEEIINKKVDEILELFRHSSLNYDEMLEVIQMAMIKVKMFQYKFGIQKSIYNSDEELNNIFP